MNKWEYCVLRGIENNLVNVANPRLYLVTNNGHELISNFNIKDRPHGVSEDKIVWQMISQLGDQPF